MQKQKIIVLCLNWNGFFLLKKMIPSLMANLDNLDLESEIWIRDNGSKDNSIKFIEGNYPEINVLKINHNRDSFSEGVNSLFLKANPEKKDILLLLNNDIEFKNNISIKNMLSTMRRTNAAIVGAKLLYKNGSISHNGVIFSKRYGNMPWHYRAGCRPADFDSKDREFQAVTAACCLIKVSNFVKAGMLNTDLVWAFEDVSLNLDVSLNQKEKVVCCGSTNIIHATSASLKKNPVNKMFLSKNVQIFKEIWFGKYEIDHDNYLKNKNYKLI